MSEINNDSVVSEENTSGATQKTQENPSGSNTESGGGEKMYPASFVQKLMDEKKSVTRRLRDLENKHVETENEILHREGKFEELNEKLKSDIENVNSKWSNRFSKIAQRYIGKQVELKAQEMGCVDTEAATAFLDFSEIGFDEDEFTVDSDKLGVALDGLKERKPYLFKTATIPPKDGSLSGKPNDETMNATNKKSLADMSLEEIKASLVEDIKREHAARG